MEMQQMIERLLAGQAKVEADRKADQEKAEADRKAMQEKADANRKADREQMLAEIRADRTKDCELLLSMQAIIDAETKAIRDKRMKVNINSCRKETTACQYEMEVSVKKIEPNPEEKKTAMEQQEIPNEEVAVHSQRTCQSETTPSQEATETEPDPGKMQSVEEQAKQETSKRRNYEKRRFTGPKCKNGIRNGVLKQQLCSKTEIKNPRTRQYLRLGKWRTTCMIYKKTIRRQIVKQALRISSVFRKTRK
jgi:hypothetical protein